MRRRLLIWLATCTVLAACNPAPEAPQTASADSVWQPQQQQLSFGYHWTQFKQNLIDEQGRVIDRSDPRLITTSEGQTYAMWFALLANEPELFDKLLTWTERNLAGGDLSHQLPAWLWGHDTATDEWQVLDSNSASDVDLLLIYALFHAADAWHKPQYHQLAVQLSELLFKRSVDWFAGHGFLLPAPYGFSEESQITINPSYWPLFVFDGLHSISSDVRWLTLREAATTVLAQNNPAGVVADWLTLDRNLQVVTAPEAEPYIGSYDAIRSYYWLAIDPQQRLLADYPTLATTAQRHNYVPEVLDWRTGESLRGDAMPGFSAVVLPYLRASAPLAHEQAIATLQRRDPDDFRGYYNRSLTLFGLAHRQCFHVTERGTLALYWQTQSEQPDWRQCDVTP